MKWNLFAIIIFLFPFCIYAESIDWFVNKALSNDRQIKILKLQAANALLSIEKKNLEKNLSVTAGVDSTGLSYSFGNETSASALSVSTSPFVSVGFPAPYETEVQLSLPFSYAIEGVSSFTPGLNIKQPLNKILGIEEDSAYDNLNDKYLIDSYKKKIAERKVEVKLSLYDKLKTLFQTKENIEKFNIQIANAKKDLNDALKLGNYDIESSNLVTLQNNVKNLERQRELANETFNNARNGLERMIGENFSSLPEKIGMTNLTIPGETKVELYPDYYLDELALSRDKELLKKNQAAEIPDISADLSVKRGNSSNSNSVNSDVINFSGGFQGVFDNFSFTVSLKSSLNPGSLSAYLGFSWFLPDRRAEKIDIENDKNIVKIDSLQLEISKQQFKNEVESLKLEIEDLAIRNAELDDDLKLAKLKLKEAENQYREGLISPENLKSVQWEVDKFKYDKLILLLDMKITSEKIGKLNLVESFQGE